jgi:hypothetical protein
MDTHFRPLLNALAEGLDLDSDLMDDLVIEIEEV